MYINKVELFPFKLALKSFLKILGIKLIHTQIDNIIALTSLQMACFSKTNLGASIKEKSNDTVPSQCTEQAYKRRVSSQGRFFRTENSPLNILETLFDNWNAIELLCNPSFLPNNTGSKQDREGPDKKN